MIEVIYKDESQEGQNGEEPFGLPRNIRQIGLAAEDYRIYMEDYVYTFLVRLARTEDSLGEAKTRVAVLTGNLKWRSQTAYLFIKGAIIAEEMEAAPDHIDFSENQWKQIQESTTASCAIIAEIGIDMKPFKTAEHICSWAGLCPGNNESAGKRKSTSVTKGNPYIKSMLCEIAWVIAGKRNTYLSAWYWRIKQKKGAKKAIVALARKLLVIIYTMLKQGTVFDESCFETRRKHCEQKQLSRYIRELEKHGYHVEAQS